MGWCHEFGAEIVEGCSHTMVAREGGCACQECGAVCRGRFPGCARVWARASAVAAGGDPAPAGRPLVPPASWAAAATRPAVGFRHPRPSSQAPPEARSEEPPVDVETLKEQVRQLTLLTERLAGRLDAVLARPAPPPRQAPPAQPAEPPAPPTPASRRVKPAPPAPSPAAWPPDALDTLVARTEWKQLKRFLRAHPAPPTEK